MRDLAAKMHDPKNGVYGICLRGKPGWGDNMAFHHHGQHLRRPAGSTCSGSRNSSKPWKDAVTFYVDLMKKYGPPGAAANSFNEILALFNQGKCGMWIDATIAASFVTDPSRARWPTRWPSPRRPWASRKGANWLWIWALAIPSSSKHPNAAQRSSTGPPRPTT
jgi:sorbitol/mannitol transport system substrate-binding protein